MTNIHYTLYGEQTRLIHDWLKTDKHCIDIVPAGSGKTFLAAIALPIFASDAKYHKGKDILYVAPTNTMIKSLVWEQLKKNCIENYGLKDGAAINNSELTIKFPNGVFIRCKSAEMKENLRGMNVGVAVLDEAALYPEESLQELTVRLRPIPGKPETEGRLIVISTPKGNGPLYTLYKQAKSQPDKFIVRHYNYLQMKSGNKDFIERQKTLLSPMKFASDYMCSFETIEDQFWYAFDKSRHCRPVQDDNRTTIFTGHDFNKKVMTAVVAKIDDPFTNHGTIEVIKSYAIKNCSTEDMAKAIRQDFPNRKIQSVIDMSGSQTNRDTTSQFGVTDKTLLEKYGFTIVNNRKSNPLISDTDNICNSFVNRGGLTVDPNDEKLLEALATYHFEDGSRKKLVKYKEQEYAHIDGLSDALRYLITHYFPIRHEQKMAEYVGMDPRLSRQNQPGFEHMPNNTLWQNGPTIEEIFGNDEPDYMTYD